MRWIVGLDLLERSRGATRFAAWLQKHTGDHLMGVHVIENSPYAFEGPGETEPDFGAWVLQRARESLEQNKVASAFAEVDAIEASAPEDGLEAAIEQGRGEAMIIGRVAARDAHGLVRLGRVARRLVRTLPSPVVVAPADLMEAEVGEGPVIVGVDMHEHSQAAIRFGRALANKIGRPLVLAYVAEPPRSIRSYLPHEFRDKARVENLDRTRARVSSWIGQHELDLGDARVEVRGGAVGPVLTTIATEENACMIVVGSRRLSTAARLFRSSVGSELAANSPIAVALVPTSE